MPELALKIDIPPLHEAGFIFPATGVKQGEKVFLTTQAIIIIENAFGLLPRKWGRGRRRMVQDAWLSKAGTIRPFSNSTCSPQERPWWS
ncbi:MAG: hypothetical protein OJF50_000758 [Nitrospira sp.]|jgi:hypothetical protein|nr:hypothetical protein [Nitrospira sp.]